MFPDAYSCPVLLSDVTLLRRILDLRVEEFMLHLPDGGWKK